MTILFIPVYFILNDQGINVFYFILLINDLFLSFPRLFYSSWPKNKCGLFYFINKINENKCGLFLFINKWTLVRNPFSSVAQPILGFGIQKWVGIVSFWEYELLKVAADILLEKVIVPTLLTVQLWGDCPC